MAPILDIFCAANFGLRTLACARHVAHRPRRNDPTVTEPPTLGDAAHRDGERRTFLDLRLQVADAAGWHQTGQALRLEDDRLPELVDVLERAMMRLSEV